MSNNPEPHARHDLLLVASLADGDLAGADRDRATAQVATCADCAALHTDLIDIARATAALPPAVAQRDFTLSPAQASALRPIGWRRLVAAIGGSRPLMSRQLGIGLTTIGLAGLLVSTLPGIPMGQSAGAAPAGGSAVERNMAAPEIASEAPGVVGIAGEGGAPSAAPAAAASSGDSAITPSSAAAPHSPLSDGIGVYGSNKTQAPAPAATDGRTSYNDASGSSQRAAVVAAPDLADTEPPPSSDAGRGLVMTGSALLLAIGIVLLLIRRRTRPAAWG